MTVLRKGLKIETRPQSTDRNNSTEHSRQLQEEGYSILAGVFGRERITELRNAVEEEHRHLKKEDPEGAQFYIPILDSPGHASFLLPLLPPFTDRDVLCIPLAMQATEELLGARYYLYTCEVNVAFAGGDSDQQIHPDEPRDQQGSVGVAWNIALHDVGPANGMTCLWPGTHLHGGQIGVAPANSTPLQPSLRAGDVLIRDLALVHQGVRNTSATDRLLLALNFKPQRSEGDTAYKGSIAPETWSSLDDERRGLLRFHPVKQCADEHARRYPNLS